MGQLKHSGYEITPNAEEADTIVVNIPSTISTVEKPMATLLRLFSLAL